MILESMAPYLGAPDTPSRDRRCPGGGGRDRDVCRRQPAYHCAVGRGFWRDRRLRRTGPRSTATATATPTVTPPAPLPKALVAVSVAEVWGGRHKVRPFDAPALQRPARINTWLRGMTFFQRSHLFKRLSTQVRYGEQVEVLGTWGELTHIKIPDQTGGRFPDGIIGWIASGQLAAQPDSWESATRVATVTADFATLDRTVAGESHPSRSAMRRHCRC